MLKILVIKFWLREAVLKMIKRQDSPETLKAQEVREGSKVPINPVIHFFYKIDQVQRTKTEPN